MLYNPSWQPDSKPKADEEWRTVLRKAAGLLETTGWLQYRICGARLTSEEGRMCVRGAIAMAATGDPYAPFYSSRNQGSSEALAAVRALQRYLSRSTWKQHPNDDIVRWNDKPGRTRAEVVAALRAAADMEPQ